ncbi:hypothetical protein C8Q76DRAFT_801233 [Earliella scabrosa]|nr:hypothetical protein C8Q76DRAFT_801233 [Earliella scabrosa]
MSLSDLLPPGASFTDALKLLYQAVGDTFTVNLGAVAASTWIAYDICLTFADEVELVWKAKWSLPKVLYFGVRYYGLVASLLYATVNSSRTVPYSMYVVLCHGWTWYEALGAATAVTVIFGEGMFVLRLWASYRGQKKVLALIAFCWLAEFTSSVVVTFEEALDITILPRPVNFPLPGCYTLAKVPLGKSLGAWIVNGSVALIFFGLMLFKFFTSDGFKLGLSTAKNNGLAKWFEVRRFSPLLYLLLRDGVMYFGMIFFVNMTNLIASVTMEGRALEGVAIPWTIAASSVGSARLLLNLRGFIGTDNSVLLTEKTTMRFEHPGSGEGDSGESSSTDEIERETVELRETKITSTGTGISEVMV